MSGFQKRVKQHIDLKNEITNQQNEKQKLLDSTIPSIYGIIFTDIGKSFSYNRWKDMSSFHHATNIEYLGNDINWDFKDYFLEWLNNEFAKNDDRFIILKPCQPIKKMLDKYGYPFKSKQHSHNYNIYCNNKEEIHKVMQQIKENPKLKEDYNFIHNLPNGVKTIVKYLTGERERERDVYFYQGLP